MADTALKPAFAQSVRRAWAEHTSNITYYIGANSDWKNLEKRMMGAISAQCFFAIRYTVSEIEKGGRLYVQFRNWTFYSFRTGDKRKPRKPHFVDNNSTKCEPELIGPHVYVICTYVHEHLWRRRFNSNLMKRAYTTITFLIVTLCFHFI
jgi:hypothetical protein